MYLELVYCNKFYWDFIRNLRNDERVMEGFIKTKYITAEEQEIYMLANSKFYRVCLFEGKPVGYVGVIENDIRICTSPDFQGMGIAKFMLKEILKFYPNAFAKIKIDNLKSLELFKSLGFKVKYHIMER